MRAYTGKKPPDSNGMAPPRNAWQGGAKAGRGVAVQGLAMERWGAASQSNGKAWQSTAGQGAAMAGHSTARQGAAKAVL